MTPDQLRTALHSLKGWYQPGKVVGIIGGEPTLHSQFEEMCEVIRNEWTGVVTTHGREPIADFDAFATQRLFDRRNGVGLWTSFGPRFIDHYETVMDTFSHWNPNDHTAGGVHQTGLVDAKEMCEALGIPWEDFPKYRDACWVQNTWSGSITPKGAYFCEHAGTIDLLYNEGRNAWPIEDGWWRREPRDFGDQMQICDMCSLCLPGPSQVDSKDRDIIGKGHKVRLETIGSPAVKGNRFEAFNRDVHIERRSVETKDSYTNGPRVSPDNRSMMPKKLSAVVTCVGRFDHLRETLWHNAAQVDELIVVTDDAAQLNALNCRGKNVKAVFTDRYHANGYAFNKGALLNDGLAAIPIFGELADWVVLTDADVFLPDNLREFVRTHALNPGVLYGAKRENAADLPGVSAEPNGYFQLFNRRAHAIRDAWPAVMSEAFCSAGGIDSWFLARFPPDKRYMLDLTCRHIPHGDGIGTGWNGSPNGSARWRQIGMLTHEWYIPLPGTPLPEHISGRLRLVDTLNADVWEGEIECGRLPDGLVGGHAGGLIFQGKDVGRNHIHVAMWG
jgi:hypothetical protein